MPTNPHPLWLTWLLPKPKLRRAAKSVFYQWVVAAGEPVAQLADMPEGELSHRFQIKLTEAQELCGLLSELPLYRSLLVDLNERGVSVVDRADVAYPELFGERLTEARLPYLLFCRGSLELLTEPGLAIYGAGAPSAEGLAMSRQIGKALAEAGQTLIGGYERGVDRAALLSALEAGGATVAILPCGLTQMIRALSPWEEAFDAGRALAVSPYAPATAYSLSLGEARQPLMAANAMGAIVVEPTAEPLGTTWWPVLFENGGQTWVWRQGDGETVGSWMGSGAKAFDAADELLADLPEVQDYTEDTEDIDLSDPEAVADAPDSGEMAPFESAGEAMDALSTGGSIPDILAKRLREQHGEEEGEA